MLITKRRKMVDRFRSGEIVPSPKCERGGERIVTVKAPGDSLDTVTDAMRIVVSEVGPRTTIALHGEWDLASTESTREVIADALARRPQCVVLDLSQLTFMDSSGIHGTVRLVRRSQALNFRLAIVPGPRTVRRVFEICRLSEHLPFIAAA